MKKRRKLQNQQIILNQDTHIKFYNNFLTFSSLNSFRLKYYYFYLKYNYLFCSYSSMLFNSFYANFFLIKLISANVLYLNFFNSYGSSLLQKFVESKNSSIDYLNYIKLSSKIRLVKNSFLNKNFIYSYNTYIDTSKEVSQSSSSVLYSTSLNCLYNNKFISANLYCSYFKDLSDFLFYLNFINFINLYKVATTLSLYIIHK